MKTGRYRLRRGWGGKAIVQYEVDCPTFWFGQVDTHIRQLLWYDVEYDKLAEIAVNLADHKTGAAHD